MRPRETTHLYQTAARGWLTAAGAALLLPEDVRVGIWLPLHLAMAGAVSIAIGGAMQNFAATLTATPQPRTVVVWTQFGLANAGALLVAVGRSAGPPWVVAVGGLAFVGAIGVLAWIVGTAWRRSLQRRHLVPLAMYWKRGRSGSNRAWPSSSVRVSSRSQRSRSPRLSSVRSRWTRRRALTSSSKFSSKVCRVWVMRA